jgi:uncharacterized membrane protein
MEAYAGDWLNLLVRWVHLITGIAWIGASFYFVWLDNSLGPPGRKRDADEGVGGELWAIHGGGFYHVQKFRVAPETLPATLHWFKWEAYSTWLSGFALFVILYYANARTYMIDPAVADLAPWQAIAISVAMLAIGWLVYDQLCKRLGFSRERVLGAAMCVFIAASAFVLSKLFAGRAMFVQVGAMLGTIMAANVLCVIIPSQRELVLAKERGEAVDPVHGQRGKQRSVHNNYFTLPVLLTMISSHYPMAFGQAHAWLVLVAMLLLAAYVRHFFNLRHRGRTVWAIPVTAALGALVLAIAIAPSRPDASRAPSFAHVERIVVQRCASCHADRPTQPGFAVAPKGVMLDTPERIVAGARQIFEQSVATRAMPIGNLTAMTDDERQQVGAWIAAGTPR